MKVSRTQLKELVQEQMSLINEEPVDVLNLTSLLAAEKGKVVPVTTTASGVQPGLYQWTPEEVAGSLTRGPHPSASWPVEGEFIWVVKLDWGEGKTKMMNMAGTASGTVLITMFVKGALGPQHREMVEDGLKARAGGATKHKHLRVDADRVAVNGDSHWILGIDPSDYEPKATMMAEPGEE